MRDQSDHLRIITVHHSLGSLCWHARSTVDRDRDRDCDRDRTLQLEINTTLLQLLLQLLSIFEMNSCPAELTRCPHVCFAVVNEHQLVCRHIQPACMHVCITRMYFVLMRPPMPAYSYFRRMYVCKRSGI